MYKEWGLFLIETHNANTYIHRIVVNISERNWNCYKKLVTSWWWTDTSLHDILLWHVSLKKGCTCNTWLIGPVFLWLVCFWLNLVDIWPVWFNRPETKWVSICCYGLRYWVCCLEVIWSSTIAKLLSCCCFGYLVSLGQSATLNSWHMHFRSTHNRVL